MNLDHDLAQDIEDELIEFPVMVGLIQHEEFGSYLIDAGLDASYVHNPHGTMRGLMVKGKSATFSQEPGSNISSILDREGVQLQGVFLTHLHFDHTAGVLDLPKDIPYVVGEDEVYVNFRFFMYGDHLAGVHELLEIGFANAVDLPPLGKAVDIWGDGSLWAISSRGHSEGHVLYLINGTEEQALVTGDACNTQFQFDTGVGPGGYSSDVEQAQVALDRMIAFKQQYPQVKLVYGHDWPEQ
jgi:glyoxylase-like metal-dependent hydrolase (beta-lactamase superfamily II)